MANIGTTSFYIRVPSLPVDEFQNYATTVFDEWESYVTRNVKIPDYSLVLDVEEGSIKGIGTVAAVLGAIYVGIGQYGSFISGLQIIDQQIHSAGDYLGRVSGKPFVNQGLKPSFHKRGESLARLKNLFVKVKKGEISVDQAMIETEVIFGSEIDDAPGFMDALKEALHKTPQQINLPFDEGELKDLPPLPKKHSSRGPAKPKQPVPPSEQYRVEVWRESREGKKNVKLVRF